MRHELPRTRSRHQVRSQRCCMNRHPHLLLTRTRGRTVLRRTPLSLWWVEPRWRDCATTQACVMERGVPEQVLPLTLFSLSFPSRSANLGGLVPSLRAPAVFYFPAGAGRTRQSIGGTFHCVGGRHSTTPCIERATITWARAPAFLGAYQVRRHR